MSFVLLSVGFPISLCGLSYPNILIKENQNRVFCKLVETNAV